MVDQIPAGFELDVGKDPAEDHIGPFYLRRADGRFAAGLRIQAYHCNGLNIAHGGVLMTMADYALCAQARFGTDDTHIVTVSLHTEFIAGAPSGSWLHSEGAVVQRTRSLVFVQGCLKNGDEVVLTYSGVGKRRQARAPSSQRQ